MITEAKMVAVGLLFGFLVVGFWYYGHTRYEAGVSHCEAVAAKAQTRALAAQRAQLARAASVQAGVTQRGAQVQAQTQQATHETVRTIVKVVHDHPAPAVCVVNPDSVRALKSAVSAANAAAGSLRVTPAGAASAARP